MPAKQTKWKITPLGYMIGIAYALALNAIFFGENYFSNALIFLLATLVTTALGILLGLLHNWTPMRVNQFWATSRRGFRQVIATAIFFSLTAAFTIGVFFAYKWISFPGFQPETGNLKWALLAGFIADLLGIGFGLAKYNLLALKQAEIEREQLEKLQLQNELEILKNQVNPHFLFNSLNVLSGLISEDQEQAELFVDKLSQVYRYLLQSNRKDWATVEEELNFIRSYFALLTTRFGESLTHQINVNDSVLKKRIPPLSLQLLVENAVKHNVVNRLKPLRVEIFASETELRVTNNIQRKPSGQVLSHGVGLSNIAEKYRMLRSRQIDVSDSDGIFCVSLPLLNPEPEVAPDNFI